MHRRTESHGSPVAGTRRLGCLAALRAARRGYYYYPFFYAFYGVPVLLHAEADPVST